MRTSLLLLASCFDTTHAFGIVPDSRSGTDVSTQCQRFFQGQPNALSSMPGLQTTEEICPHVAGRTNFRLRTALGQGSSSWCGGATSSEECATGYVHHLQVNEEGVEGEEQVVYTLCAWNKDLSKCQWDVSTTEACPLAPTAACGALASRAEETIHQGSSIVCGEFVDAASCVSSVRITEGTDRFHVCKWQGGSCKNLDGPMNCLSSSSRRLSEADSPCESASEEVCNLGAYGYLGDDFFLPTGDYANAPPAPELHVCTWNKDSAKCETDYTCPYACAITGSRYVPVSSGSDVKVSYGETAIDNERFCSANVEVGGDPDKCVQHFEARKAGGVDYGLEPCVWKATGVATCTKYGNLGYDLPACI